LSKDQKNSSHNKQSQTPYIAIGLSFFEDINPLEKCLDSVLGNPDLRPYVKVLAVDGKYKGYPIDHDLSEDGSRELIMDYARRYPGLVQLYDYPNDHERFKRQKYVNLAAEQEIPWLFILDSDEWIQVPKVERFIKELKRIEEDWYETNIENALPTQRVGNVVTVMCVELGQDSGLPVQTKGVPRLWYRPQDMHYTTKHYWFARKEDIPDPNKTENFRQDNLSLILGAKYKSLSVSNIVIWHSHQDRDDDREKRRKYYEYERLPKLEGSPKLGIFDKENIKQ